MLKKLSNILFSTRLTAILFILFATAMAVGTFLDAGQETSPTPYTRNLIYNAFWFEAIMGVFVINFVGNIFRYRLYKKEKWATLTLHLAFIFILLGAFITRYIGYEGVMRIREGETENTFLSQKTYVTAYIDGDYRINGVPQRLPIEKEVDFSYRLDNNFKVKTRYHETPVEMELVEFIQGAEEDIVEDPEGDNYLKIVESSGGAPHNHFLKEGGVENIHNTLFTLNNPTEGAINIAFDDDGLMIQSPFEGEFLTMATRTQGKLVKDSLQPLMLRSRYIIGNMQMVFPKPVVKGRFDVVKKPEMLKGDEDGIALKITANDESKVIKLIGGQGHVNAMKQDSIGGMAFALSYGSKVLELPFSVKLNDFIADKYPGTEKSYSSFASEVTVLDEEKGDYDYRIFMNNILDHRGYRFFQASFDPDERGTILSVNHDQWGTWITYLGYMLLYFGLMAILFDKNTRFADLKRALNKVKNKKTKLVAILILCFGLQINAQEEQHSPNDGHDHNLDAPSVEQIDSILMANIAPKEHANLFGKMVLQDIGGRMMPVNTYASELLRKLTKYDHYGEMDANQAFISMNESPAIWYNVPLIYLKAKKADSIRKIIGIPKDQKYAKLVDFFDDDFRYKLSPYLDEAYRAKIPNGFQKEFKETDQRVNLLANTLDGQSLKIFPRLNDDNNKWLSFKDLDDSNYKGMDSVYGKQILPLYFTALRKGKSTGEFKEANEFLKSIRSFQTKHGPEVIISEDKVNTEVLYNQYDIFKKLFSWYMYAGTLLFILLIVQIFKDQNKILNLFIKVLIGIVVILFILHTAGLIVRWYISGHAPWSDAYESMIYVAWATMFFGLAFGRKSSMTIAATAFVTSMILMIAHWNWMDPAIANLQPVLDSYWLMIHVAVIVASYGPFTLGMILGIVSLLLMILTNDKNREKMFLNIKELTIINEMSLTVGLVMLAIGNFLGGMWANESWGRYWGWDPKETWALISIMIYAFVIHMRLVPGLRGRFGFNLMSIIAFASILMTYFGVNFYLAGLHSYASGDQIVSLQFIAIAAVVIALLGLLAYRKYAVFYRK
ncbi:MAG: cytochrome C biogenesis protein [Flavobacteriaceae bacterium]|nr:cytochrome c biogenesis protein CcsA [Flavobacteriaceae bacterium]NNK26921.1 cytochrome c biogenesis protein CcsA [Flavobacteriaceae bacterium]RZV66129.1 MAG: cytochrome C biogenesis protein [Flavobacteriaceae bacterium]